MSWLGGSASSTGLGWPVESLLTERLTLRPLQLEDADVLARLYADPYVRRYFPEGTLTRHETTEELEWFIDVYDRRYGLGLWATLDEETGEFIGRCGLIPWRLLPSRADHVALTSADEEPDDDATYEVEVAYLLAKEHWGRGFATEAARAIVAYALDHVSSSRLICLIDPENAPSRRVAAKIGMSSDGVVDVDGDVVPLYSMAVPARGGSDG